MGDRFAGGSLMAGKTWIIWWPRPGIYGRNCLFYTESIRLGLVWLKFIIGSGKAYGVPSWRSRPFIFLSWKLIGFVKNCLVAKYLLMLDQRIFGNQGILFKIYKKEIGPFLAMPLSHEGKDGFPF